MIIPEVTSRPIDRVAIDKERKFSIKPSAKAFRILSSTIYPDPIAAPIRELGTNAADSHRDAGVREPFLVHLPNQLEPYFSIRDYGTGISDENIDKVYCTYFESTRTESNNFTGGFGLGSKTPFCYSDTFTVISYFNGRKMIFTAFLEDGEPKIAKFADDPTDERNGLEVSFPVKTDDIGRFISTARKVYSRFVDKPIIVGCADFKLDDVTYVMKGNGWSIRENKSQYSSSTESSAVMGNISYPLDAYKLGTNDATRALIQCGVEIDFPVGELQPTVSREHLQYDQDSIKKINTRLAEVCVELGNIFQNEISTSKNLFDARLKYGKLLGSTSTYGWQLKTIFKSIAPKYNNVPVSDVVHIRDIMLKYNKDNKIITPIESFADRTYSSARGDTVTIKKVGHTDIHVVAGMHFMLDDMESGGRSRIRQYVIANNPQCLYVINNNIVSNTKLFKEIIDSIGIDVSDIKKSSSLDKVVHKKRQPRPKTDIQDLLVYNGSNNHRSTYCWSTASIDTVKGEHYYVKVTGFNTDDIDLLNLSTLFSAVNSILGTKIEVVGIRSSATNILKLPNWKDFIEFAKKTVQDYIKKEKLEQLIVNSTEYNMYGQHIEQSFKSTDLNADSLMFDHLKNLEYMFDQQKKLSKMGWITKLEQLKSLGLVLIDKVESEHKLRDDRAKVLESYPLINYIVPERDTWRMINPEKWKVSVLHYLNSVKKV